MSVRVFVSREHDTKLGARIELDDDESHYLKVRRVRVGASLELLDGLGGAWTGSLVATGRRATVEIQAVLARPPALPERIVLLGLPEPAAALEALTHAGELGASELVLVRCERSQGHAPSAGRIERVLRATMRQCGRPTPPLVRGGPPETPWTLSDALDHRAQLPGLFGEPAARGSSPHDTPASATTPAARDHDLRDALLAGADLRLLVGPEGGLSAAEIEAARAAGLERLWLGPWILRTPTAVAAMLARAWAL